MFHLITLQGVDLRQYSKQVESELLDVENASIQDCILVWLIVAQLLHLMTSMRSFENACNIISRHYLRFWYKLHGEIRTTGEWQWDHYGYKNKDALSNF